MVGRSVCGVFVWWCGDGGGGGGVVFLWWWFFGIRIFFYGVIRCNSGNFCCGGFE